MSDPPCSKASNNALETLRDTCSSTEASFERHYDSLMVRPVALAILLARLSTGFVVRPPDLQTVVRSAPSCLRMARYNGGWWSCVVSFQNTTMSEYHAMIG